MLDKTKEAVGLDEDVDEDDIDLYEMGLPVVSFRFTDEFKKQYPDIKQFVPTLTPVLFSVATAHDLSFLPSTGPGSRASSV